MSEAKRRRLEQLALSWRSCTACSLSRSRERVVFYRGNPEARIAIVGEAPGREEDARGVPFVGPAGKVIDGLLLDARVAPDEVCFLNMVGCRPPANRVPRREELAACAPRTTEMLRVIDPVVVLMLGLTAAKLALVTSIGPWRGKPVDVELLKGWSCRGVVTYHPSFLLRQGYSEKIRRHMLSDIKVVRALSRKD